jgi:ankyrin repeat protein
MDGRSKRFALAVLVFLAFGAVFAQDVPGDSPPPSLQIQLIRAVARGDVGQTAALLSAGADPKKALMTAVVKGQAETFRLLVQAGAPLTGPEGTGSDLLGMALFGSNAKVQEREAQRQKERAVQGKEVLPTANGFDDIIALLLENGVPADSPQETGLTPLMMAAMYGNEKAAALLLEHGADPGRELAGEGWTVLHMAAQFGHWGVVQAILKAGSSADKADKAGRTPLMLAACGGEGAALQRLLGGEDTNFFFVQETCGKEFLETVQTLLERGADPNRADENGVTPLLAASTAGNLGIARALLEAGAAPNLGDGQGRTPLMAAAKAGKPALVELLLSRGADPKAVALDGTTALTLARAGKNREVLRLLRHALQKE